MLAALVLAAPPAAASTVPYRTDGDLVALASRVVHGRVLSVRTEPGDSNRIYTVARVAVIEDLTGVDESIIEVRELGGRIGIDEMFVAGTPGYVAGQEVLLLLERGPRGLRNVALSFSAFHVVPEGATGAEAGVVRFAAGLDVIGEQAESRRTRTLAEMRTIVGAVKGVQPVRPARGQPRPATRCASSSRSRCSAARAGVRPTAAPRSTGIATPIGRIRSPAATSTPRSPRRRRRGPTRRRPA